jgi:ribulose-phosphate 3-epimerase
MITEAGLSVDVEIDGGVTADNIQIPLEAGANVIVAGSAVFNGDIDENIANLSSKM